MGGWETACPIVCKSVGARWRWQLDPHRDVSMRGRAGASLMQQQQAAALKPATATCTLRAVQPSGEARDAHPRAAAPTIIDRPAWRAWPRVLSRPGRFALAAHGRRMKDARQSKDRPGARLHASEPPTSHLTAANPRPHDNTAAQHIRWPVGGADAIAISVDSPIPTSSAGSLITADSVPRPGAAAPIGFGRAEWGGPVSGGGVIRTASKQELLIDEAFMPLLSRGGPCYCGADETPTPASYCICELEAGAASGPAGAIMCTAFSFTPLLRPSLPLRRQPRCFRRQPSHVELRMDLELKISTAREFLPPRYCQAKWPILRAGMATDEADGRPCSQLSYPTTWPVLRPSFHAIRDSSPCATWRLESATLKSAG